MQYHLSKAGYSRSITSLHSSQHRQHALASVRRPLHCRSRRYMALSATAAAGSGAFASKLNQVQLLSHQNGVYTVGGSIETPISRNNVYHMLIDYPHLNRVFSAIDECHTHTEQDALQLLQVCRWEFLAFSGTFKTLLNVHEEPEAGKVVFSLIKSAFMKDFEGQWQLTDTPDGGCHVEHKLKVQPVLDAPALFSGYSQRIFVKQVTKVLEDLLAALKSQE